MSSGFWETHPCLLLILRELSDKSQDFSFLASLVEIYERFNLSFQTVANTSLLVLGQLQTIQVLQKGLRM